MRNWNRKKNLMLVAGGTGGHIYSFDNSLNIVGGSGIGGGGLVFQEGGFTRPDDSRNPYEHIFILVLLGIRSSLGETCCFEVQVPQNVW